MLRRFTARYTKIDSGYMGQLVEWPQVVTEGTDIDDCRTQLQDALEQMVAGYREQGMQIPHSIVL